MAENLVVAPAGSGVQVAADEVTLKGTSGVLVQYVKILDGTDNSAVPIGSDQSGDPSTPAALNVNIAGYGATVQCKSYPVTTAAVTLAVMLGTPLAKRKNVMIMNVGAAGVVMGDNTTQAWPLDPSVPFVQDWGPGVNPTFRSLSGTNTVVVLETA